MEPGAKLSHYKIIEKLASGSVGDVYVAEDTRRNREVVLKVLRPELTADPRHVKKLLLRNEALSKLEHPNILAALEVERANDSQFIVAPMVDGRPLDQVVGNSGLLLDRIFELGIPLADAIAAAHEADVVHGGLKPSNVLLGRDGRLRVLDFAMGALHPDLASQLASIGTFGDEKRATEEPPPDPFAIDPLADSSLADAGGLVRLEEEPPAEDTADPFGDFDEGFGAGEDDAADEALQAAIAKLKPAERRLLATVSYLSPEQIDGQQPDQRSDIFSLGILLYLMATGRPAFPAENPTAAMDMVLEGVPASIFDTNPGLPRHLGRIIRRCLEKDPERRYQSAKDLRNDLEGLKAEIVSGELQLEGRRTAARSAPVAGRAGAPGDGRAEAAVGLSAEGPRVVAGPSPRGRAAQPPDSRQPGAVPPAMIRAASGWGFVGDWRFWMVAAAVLVVALVAGFLAGSLGAGSEPSMAEGAVDRITLEAGVELFPRLTPDGNAVLYASPRAGDWDLYLQRLGEQAAVNLTPESDDDDTQPALSPDGRRVAFRSGRDGGGVFIKDLTDDSVQLVVEEGFNPSWSPDGNQIVVATDGVFDTPYRRRIISDLWVFELESGASRPLVSGDAVQPAWSPGGARVAYWGFQPGSRRADIWTVAADGGEPLQVTDDAGTNWAPAWSPDGRHLYFSSDRTGSVNIWRVAIDEGSGRVRGRPEPVTAAGTVWSSHASFARGLPGRMVYVESRRLTELRGLPFSSSRGRIAGEVATVTSDARNSVTPCPSPDGAWVAFATGEGQQEDIYVVRADGTELEALTADAARDRLPRWSPDGSRLAFVSNRGGSYQIWSIRPDGSDLRQVTALSGRQAELATWAPDGSRICVNTTGDLVPDMTFLIDPSEAADQLTLRDIPPLMGDEVFEAHSWSPDASRLAGTLRRANGSAGGIAVFALQTQEYERLTDFGAHPVWLSDNRRVLFQDGNRILLVDSRSQDVREVFSANPDEIAEGFSVSGDNRRIYVSVRSTDSDLWLLDLGQR